MMSPTSSPCPIRLLIVVRTLLLVAFVRCSLAKVAAVVGRRSCGTGDPTRPPRCNPFSGDSC
ncbi:hypothetical protein BS78_10G175700 [Paspalum vaginatum]|nr:hypothetical protein BS78_10G175700 [Paspalum vaginatum]